MVALLALGGCSGTQLSFEGQVCGAPVSLVLNDRRDRMGSMVEVECPGGGKVVITLDESSTSAVASADAAYLDSVARLISAVSAGAMP